MSSHFQVKFLKFHPGPNPNSDHFTTNTVSQWKSTLSLPKSLTFIFASRCLTSSCLFCVAEQNI